MWRIYLMFGVYLLVTGVIRGMFYLVRFIRKVRLFMSADNRKRKKVLTFTALIVIILLVLVGTTSGIFFLYASDALRKSIFFVLTIFLVLFSVLSLFLLSTAWHVELLDGPFRKFQHEKIKSTIKIVLLFPIIGGGIAYSFCVAVINLFCFVITLNKMFDGLGYM